MTNVPGVEQAPPRWTGRDRLVAFAPVALAVAVAWVFSSGLLDTHHRGGDPGAVRQRALRQISAVLPAGAVDRQYADGTPHWDSCDGRPGTEGWDDITVGYHFTSSLSADAVIAKAASEMRALHWTALPPLDTAQGPVRQWAKTIARGVSAHAQLSNDHSTPGTPYWDLSAGAPPEGQRVSGC